MYEVRRGGEQKQRQGQGRTRSILKGAPEGNVLCILSFSCVLAFLSKRTDLGPGALSHSLCL